MKPFAIALVLILSLAPPSSASASLPQTQPGGYMCPDGKENPAPGTTGEITLASQLTQARDYRVHNNQSDAGKVVVINSEGQETVVDLPANGSVDVGVPAGGSLKVTDPPDSGGSAPGGTYETL